MQVPPSELNCINSRCYASGTLFSDLTNRPGWRLMTLDMLTSYWVF